MKNKYYDDFATFRKAVELFFQNFSQYKDQLKKLLNFKFGIIKQFSISIIVAPQNNIRPTLGFVLMLSYAITFNPFGIIIVDNILN